MTDYVAQLTSSVKSAGQSVIAVVGDPVSLVTYGLLEYARIMSEPFYTSLGRGYYSRSAAVCLGNAFWGIAEYNFISGSGTGMAVIGQTTS
jgi:hypothetical protein